METVSPHSVAQLVQPSHSRRGPRHALWRRIRCGRFRVAESRGRPSSRLRGCAPEGIEHSSPSPREHGPCCPPRTRSSCGRVHALKNPIFLGTAHQRRLTTARCGPKHGPCRRFSGAVRADEPPPPQTATRLGKAARQQTAASHVPPAWSRSPPAPFSALGGHAPRIHDSSRLARPPGGELPPSPSLLPPPPPPAVVWN
jgi:hypothetical protein